MEKKDFWANLLAEVEHEVGTVAVDAIVALAKSLLHAKRSQPTDPPVHTAADGPGTIPPTQGPGGGH